MNNRRFSANISLEEDAHFATLHSRLSSWAFGEEMNIAKAFIIATLLMATASYGDEVSQNVQASSILSGKVQIIGHVGLPLGTVFRMEGLYVDGSELRTKEYDHVILLKVIKVNDSDLKDSIILRFKDLEEEIRRRTEIGGKFVGFAYETGYYAGVPSAAWKYIQSMTTTSYFFETSLVILREITEPVGGEGPGIPRR